eukprot:9476320-Pyramimonas_sp.AAC.1
MEIFQGSWRLEAHKRATAVPAVSSRSSAFGSRSSPMSCKELCSFASRLPDGVRVHGVVGSRRIAGA